MALLLLFFINFFKEKLGIILI